MPMCYYIIRFSHIVLHSKTPSFHLIHREYASLYKGIISSDNGSSSFWCQAIVWSNDDLLFVGSLAIYQFTTIFFLKVL